FSEPKQSKSKGLKQRWDSRPAACLIPEWHQRNITSCTTRRTTNAHSGHGVIDVKHMEELVLVCQNRRR
ncbi:hypothetical protein MUK42_05453, partial [Musa troglodytarum]